MSELEVIVLSRAEAGDFLASPTRCADLGFVVSIGDPEDPPPPGISRVREMLRLHFYDTGDDLGPSAEHVRQLIDFAHAIAGRPGRVLAHCQAGISRSAAAAYIIYAVALGEGREEEALERVFANRPMAVPNQRMVRIADRLLGRNGALVRALQMRNELR